jgi:hypothetical protein
MWIPVYPAATNPPALSASTCPLYMCSPMQFSGSAVQSWLEEVIEVSRGEREGVRLSRGCVACLVDFVRRGQRSRTQQNASNVSQGKGTTLHVKDMQTWICGHERQ